RDPARGWGSLNMSRYSNKEFDKLVEQALGTMDFAKRQELLKQAAVFVERDAVMVPLFFLAEATGTKKTISFKPRLDRYLIPSVFTAVESGERSRRPVCWRGSRFVPGVLFVPATPRAVMARLTFGVEVRSRVGLFPSPLDSARVAL